MLEPEEGRWLTYVELGQLLEVTPGAARMYARRRGWSHRTPNAYGDRARVLVPPEAFVQPRTAVDAMRTPYAITRVQEEPNGPDQVHVHVHVLEQAITTLREQLERERGRVDRAEARIDQLQTALSDAVAAERIAASEASGLRAQLAARQGWRLRRRLAWALRGK